MDPYTAFQAAILLAGSVSFFVACACCMYRAALAGTEALADHDAGGSIIDLVDRGTYAALLVVIGVISAYIGRELWPSADLHDVFIYVMATWSETR